MAVKRLTILSANPQNTSRLRIDKEIREIKEGLKRSKKRAEYKIVEHEAVRMRDLRRAMLDDEPHIVHFSGHGGLDGIILEDEKGDSFLVAPSALASLFALFKNSIVCVFLNSCFSDSQAAAISEHIPYVVGMPSAIPDSTAIEFAIGFYDAIGAGRSIEDAFKFGVSAINTEDITPILRMRTNKYLPSEPLVSHEAELALERVIQFARENSQTSNWAGLNRLAAEIGSLLWAVNKAYELKQWSRVLEFRELLGDFLYWRGFWQEGIDIGLLFYNAAQNLGDKISMGWTAIYPLARLEFYRGEYSKSASWSQTSLNLFREQGEAYGEAAAYRYLGRAFQAQNDLVQAEECFEAGYKKAVQFNSAASHYNLQGHLLASMASVQFLKQQYPLAQENLNKALSLYQSTGDLPGIGNMQLQLGKVALELNNFCQATELFNQSLETIGIIDSRQIESEIFLAQADLYNRIGNTTGAVEKVNLALGGFAKLHFQDGIERSKALFDRIDPESIHSDKP